MLLAVADCAERGALERNEIHYGAALREHFALYIRAVRGSANSPQPHYPFFHLHKKSGFWYLHPVAGRESFLSGKGEKVRHSHNGITDNISHASLDPELHTLLLDPQTRRELRKALIESWPPEKQKQVWNIINQSQSANQYESTLPRTEEPSETIRHSDNVDEVRGIAEVTPSLGSHVTVSGKSPLEYFEKQQTEAPESFNPSDIEDARQKIFSAILRRQGQQTFRRKLLRAYRKKCAITGCETPWVLEAAHITPYRGTKTNTLANGIILRADIHTLFDLGLISVDPATLCVKVSSLLHGTEYATLDGRPLALPTTKSARPSKDALHNHFSTFRR